MFRKFFFLLLILPLIAIPQKKDSISWLAFHASMGFHLPGADLSERFGPNQTVGAGVQWKSPTNFFLRVHGNYIFGGIVKIKDSLFREISTSDGYVIDGNGQYAEIYTYERGYYIILDGGKILPVGFLPHIASGLMVSGGVGFLQHKIRIYNPENTAPQVIGEYAKGYDFLSNGIAFRQGLGLSCYKLKKIFNVRIELEIIEAITRCRRDYLFPLHGPDKKTRLDLLFGIMIQYYFPIDITPKKKSHTYYF
ncbi:MAG: hypothetical protein N2Z72_06295 [Bacteroidales bacterium]|nr:hypothetical protein [Bacteroidales bacterium]